MNLTANQISQYQGEGYLFFPGHFDAVFMHDLGVELQSLMEADHPGNVYEKDGQTLRAMHGSHDHSAAMNALVRHPALLRPAQALLGPDLYVHQFKVNIKAAFSGEQWPWHQDYIFWKHEDGMPTPQVINAVIFADEVNHFNGPFCMIPGSHKEGCIEVAPEESTGNWEDNFSSNLKYSLDQKKVRSLWESKGATMPVGPAGSLLFFDANLAHASANNISPFDRKLIIVTYNRTDNAPAAKGKPRPSFLVSNDYRPLTD